MSEPMPDPSAAKKWDAATAVGLGAAFFALYASTLCRSVFWYDSAELVTAAVTLGITHPPGYPVYGWIGHALTWLPLDPALAVNAMSAMFGAAAVGLVFLVCRELGLDRGPSAIGAASLGAGSVFWTNAVVAEVYCPAVAGAALVTYLLLRGVNERKRAFSFAAAFIAGVALGLHLSIATLGLGFAWLVWLNGRCYKRMIAAAGAALLGSMVFLYIPLRAAQDPALNVCDPSSLGQFVWYVSGGAYKRWFSEGSGALARSAHLGGELAKQVTWVGIALAAVGIAWLARARPRITAALALMAAGNVAVFFYYQAHDVEVFLLQTTMVLCCFVGAGAQATVTLLSTALPERLRSSAGLAATAALFALPVALISSNRAAADMSDFSETEPYLAAVADALPTDAVIVNFATPEEWKRYAVFGMYGQLVRGMRRDVRHWISPDLRKLAHEIDAGGRVYAYTPHPLLEGFFEVEDDGPLLRVVGAKPDAAARAPRKAKNRRTCATFTELEVRDDG